MLGGLCVLDVFDLVVVACCCGCFAFNLFCVVFLVGFGFWYFAWWFNVVVFINSVGITRLLMIEFTRFILWVWRVSGCWCLL